MKRKHMIINPRNAALLALALATGSALAVDGTWINNGSSNWSVTTNWQDNNADTLGDIADGVGATATFTLNLTSNRNFTFDTSLTLGTLNTSATGRSSNFLVSGGSILTLDNTGSTNAVVTTASTSGQNHNIAVPIELMDSLDVNNSLTTASGKSVAFNNTITVQSGASNSGNLTITNTSNNNNTGGPMTNFNGLISDGAGSITLVNAAGSMNIANAGNTFSGTTTNSSGIIRIDNATALQNSALNTSGSITGNATNGLRLNTGVTTLTLGGLTGSKNINASGTGVFSTASSNYGSVTALTLNPGTGVSHTYDGAIEDGAPGMTLTKTGDGTQILNGTCTHTGDTLVSAGTLFVNGALSAGTNDVTVATTGAIGGDGSIAGSLDFASGADFVFSTTTTLDVAGAVTFGGFGITDLVGLDSSVAAGTYTLINGGTVDFTNVFNLGAGNAVSLGGGKSAYLQSGSLQVVVTAIPEPSTALLGAIGLLGLLRRRRN